jgi:flagellar basal-body rod protein FlgC
MFDALRISGSGMTAERLRMDVIASNIANAQTTRDVDGEPYRRRQVVLRPGTGFDAVLRGVEVAAIQEDPRPPRRVYDPGHPDADADGYVSLPNISPITEMVDLIGSSRAYEANVTALNQAKQMFTRTLDLLR